MSGTSLFSEALRQARFTVDRALVKSAGMQLPIPQRPWAPGVPCKHRASSNRERGRAGRQALENKSSTRENKRGRECRPCVPLMIPWLGKSSRTRLVGWRCLRLRTRCTGTSEAHPFVHPTGVPRPVVTCRFVARMDDHSYGRVRETVVVFQDRGQVLGRKCRVSIRPCRCWSWVSSYVGSIPECKRLALPCFQYIHAWVCTYEYSPKPPCACCRLVAGGEGSRKPI